MNKQEFVRLMGYYVAARNAPHSRVTPRRRAKNGIHLGQGAMQKKNAAPRGVWPTVTLSSRI